jgi:hypothetical protein
MTIGYWRNIYHTSFLTTSFEAVNGNAREYFVPEIYLKEREIRKIELGLKDTEELRTLFRKQPEV